MPRDKMGLFSKIKNVILSPNKFFESIKTESELKYSLVYLLVIDIIYILLTYAVTMVGLGNGFGGLFSFTLTTAIVFYATGIIATFVFGGIIHLSAKLFKGKGNYLSTFKALVYGSTPAVLFGWIPFVGIIPSIYSLYLEIKGLSRLHQFSFVRGLLALIVGGIVSGIIIVIIAFLFFLPYLQSLYLSQLPIS